MQFNTAYVDYIDLAVRCSRKAVKLNHSLTHSHAIFSTNVHSIKNHPHKWTQIWLLVLPN